MQSFDVVISGGGLSGALLALSCCHLKKNNGDYLSIAIIEATNIEYPLTSTFDDRVLALAHGSSEYLNSVGAWQHIKPFAEAIEKIHISDRGHYGKARLTAKEHHVNALGYVVEMSKLGQEFLSQLNEHNHKVKNITWFSPDSIENITWKKDEVALLLASGKELTASLLLGCDGAQSVCRQFANISTTSTSYNQNALIANVAIAQPHQNIAFERFTENGPIAMLPMANDASNKQRCSLVWTLSPEEATRISQLSDSEFLLALEQAFGTWFGTLTHVGKRNVFPLSLVQVERNIYHRMALIGNASHTIHPIAGQGFNLGIRDIKVIAELIKNTLINGDDIGGNLMLNSYANSRVVDQQQVINFTDSLVSLFSNQYPPLVIGRNIGLKVLNYLSPLKKTVVNKTMGY